MSEILPLGRPGYQQEKLSQCFSDVIPAAASGLASRQTGIVGINIYFD
ncbi:MAG: hypothetical protein KAJ14_01915 [Candidatus Omnitrophica bacterium]|nr:hypothetical protein [Candidatus Omnitrophota bacterium]